MVPGEGGSRRGGVVQGLSVVIEKSSFMFKAICKLISFFIRDARGFAVSITVVLLGMTQAILLFPVGQV